MASSREAATTGVAAAYLIIGSVLVTVALIARGTKKRAKSSRR